MIWLSKKNSFFYGDRKKPTVVEYFSYMLNFHSVLAGPFFMFADYQDFIEGTHYAKRALHTVPMVGNNICLENWGFALCFARSYLFIIIIQLIISIAFSI